MDENGSKDSAPTSATEDLGLLDRVFDDAKQRRAVIADKLSSLIDTMTINTNAPRETEVQLQLVNTYLGVLKDNESGILKRVGSKLKKLDSDSSSKHSAAVAELLSRVSSGSVKLGTAVSQPTTQEVDALLEKEFRDNGLEPILESELRTDPKDVDDR